MCKVCIDACVNALLYGCVCIVENISPIDVDFQLGVEDGVSTGKCVRVCACVCVCVRACLREVLGR